MAYYVYMLTDNDNNVLYTGVTNQIERRISEHRSELYTGFTKRYHLHKLVYVEEWNSIEQAIKREKQLKGWSRAKKNALIATVNPKWKEYLPWET